MGFHPAMLPALLPLFPLPRVVLFPGTFLPLHIFEERYRQMTAECLAAHGHFILVLTRAHEGSDLVPAETATYGVGCLARIVHAEPLPDGRFNLLIQGQQAVKVNEEPSSSAYRVTTWEAIPFDMGAPISESLRAALVERAIRFATRTGSEDQVRNLTRLDLPAQVLVNTLAMALDLDPVEKQFLLEAGSPMEFADRFQHILAFAMERGDSAAK